MILSEVKPDDLPPQKGYMGNMEGFNQQVWGQPRYSTVSSTGRKKNHTFKDEFWLWTHLTENSTKITVHDFLMFFTFAHMCVCAVRTQMFMYVPKSMGMCMAEADMVSVAVDFLAEPRAGC